MLLLLLALATAQPAPTDDPGAWGVVVHTPYHGDALKALGVQWVRLGVPEDPAETDKLLDYYLSRGFHVIATFSIDPKASGQKPDALIQAPAQRAGALAGKYAGGGIVWEIGNEPDVFSTPDLWRTPENYARLARTMAKEIKQANTNARVAALSVGWMDRDFIVRALDVGLLADGTIDLIAYHGYHRLQIQPEGRFVDDLKWLRETVARHSPAGRDVSVIDTERGYALSDPHTGKNWGNWRNVVYTEEEQAAYLARHYLESLFAGVGIVVWYKDMNGESGYSLFYRTEKNSRGLRPMGHVYCNLAHLLPEPPAKLGNDRYDVTLLSAREKTSDPNTVLQVRTFWKHGDHEQLIVAIWNPIEIANGKVLDSRRRVGDNFVESWRQATADDRAVLDVQVELHAVADRIANVSALNLLALDSVTLSHPIAFTPRGASAVTAPVAVGAMPVVLVIDLR